MERKSSITLRWGLQLSSENSSRIGDSYHDLHFPNNTGNERAAACPALLGIDAPLLERMIVIAFQKDVSGLHELDFALRPTAFIEGSSRVWLHGSAWNDLRPLRPRLLQPMKD
mmetsp:Transcript_63320/g.169284  ORF Transcript_63320/g.169284 Transcript_63320/m.169284 type:complete len:113 (+) Transcript_63320:433-771(+)